MKIRAYYGLHTLGLIGIVLISGMILSGCSKRKEPPPSPPPSLGEQTTPPSGTLPDLVISAIEVFPAQPQAGQHFGINVYVRNVGQAPSGQYDLAIFIKDVSSGATYPLGTFRKEGMQPGENIPAYSSTDRLVNNPGSHQVNVQIQPFLFKDGNDQNNTAIWAFTVK